MKVRWNISSWTVKLIPAEREINLIGRAREIKPKFNFKKTKNIFSVPAGFGVWLKREVNKWIGDIEKLPSVVVVLWDKRLNSSGILGFFFFTFHF